jgi:hypothetical protein
LETHEHSIDEIIGASLDIALELEVRAHTHLRRALDPARVLGVFLAVQATSLGLQNRRHVAVFLREHRHLSVANLRQLPLDTLKACVAPQLVEVEGFLLKFPAEVPIDSISRVLKVRTRLARHLNG